MILYLICGFGMVTCIMSPLSRLTAQLRIFHVCHNENFRNRYLSFYWKKWFYIWYVALAWWLVPCLPFPGLLHIYFLFTARLIIFHFCCNENFRNRYLGFHWKKWFSCLPCEFEFFMFLQHFLIMSVEIYTNLTQMNEWGGILSTT